MESVNMETMPLNWRHIIIFIKSTLGQVLGSGLATLIGIIIPMIQILAQPELTSIEQGVVSSMSLLGIMVGSLILGNLSDQHGYLKLFRLCPALIFIASVFAYYSDSIIGLSVCLFLMGLGIGGEYSIGSDYISELMPKKWSLFMVGASKATSAIGSILTAICCYFMLKSWGNAESWNKLFMIVSALSFMMILLRIRFAQSPSWLLSQGRPQEAKKAVKLLLGNAVTLNTPPSKTSKDSPSAVSLKQFLKQGNTKKIIFSGIPWACEGLGVYGIGIFLPILIMSLGLGNNSKNEFQQIINSIEFTIYINIFILIGFIIGLFIVNRFYHVKTQFWGFTFSALGLLILFIGYQLKSSDWILILGFLIFEICLNAGPHLLTYIIPQQIYPLTDRGTGDGIAASIGKLGGVIGVFFIPILLSWGGPKLVLITSLVVMLIGAFITITIGKQVLPKEKPIS